MENKLYILESNTEPYKLLVYAKDFNESDYPGYRAFPIEQQCLVKLIQYDYQLIKDK